MHRLKPAGVVTLCGWNTGKARSNGIAVAKYSDGELFLRPWWKLCEKGLATEREIARLSSMDDEQSMSD